MLKTRVLTAIVLLPAFLAALFFLPPAGWALFCSVVAGIAAWEWARLAGLSGVVRQIYPGVSALLVALVLYLKPSLEGILSMLIVSALFWCGVAPLWLRYKWRLQVAGNLNVLLGWAIIVPASVVLALLRMDGWSLLALLAIAWVADSAAYFSGKTFGRNKLAPEISPGKTWEGVYGAALFVSLYCALIPGKPLLFSGLGWAKGSLGQAVLWVVIGLLLMAVSIVGDLLESLFKRQAGMKDSSHLLPGHGGVLDRIDSLLALLPVAACVLYLSLLI